MVIATVCVFTACGEGDHTEHNFGEWSVSTPASCEKEGERTRKCAICGFVETQTIDALGRREGRGTSYLFSLRLQRNQRHSRGGTRLGTCQRD